MADVEGTTGGSGDLDTHGDHSFLAPATCCQQEGQPGRAPNCNPLRETRNMNVHVRPLILKDWQPIPSFQKGSLGPELCGLNEPLSGGPPEEPKPETPAGRGNPLGCCGSGRPWAHTALSYLFCPSVHSLPPSLTHSFVQNVCMECPAFQILAWAPGREKLGSPGHGFSLLVGGTLSSTEALKQRN